MLLVCFDQLYIYYIILNICKFSTTMLSYCVKRMPQFELGQLGQFIANMWVPKCNVPFFFCYFYSPAKKFTGIPMCALLANKRYELLYNCGIQLLHIGRPLAAFECLMEAVQVYHSNPRLWLRLAECCISANKGVWLNWRWSWAWSLTLFHSWVFF